MARILLIDDEVLFLSCLGNLLTEAGHQVMAATSGEEGIAILEQTPLDLVITDLVMPNKDGFDVIRSAQHSRPDIKIIAMSGTLMNLKLLSVAKTQGATYALQKPFTLEQLLETVDRCLVKKDAGSNFDQPGPWVN